MFDVNQCYGSSQKCDVTILVDCLSRICCFYCAFVHKTIGTFAEEVLLTFTKVEQYIEKWTSSDNSQ